MKKLLYSTIFSLAVATASLPSIAQAQTVNYDPSAPRIVSTDIDRNDRNHSITLYTGARPLSYVTITAPDNVSIDEGTQVTTESGRQIEAYLFRGLKQDNQFVLAFAQPVPARTTLKITLQEVEPTVPGAGNFFNYELAGKHLGLERLVPYGVARFQANTTVRP